MRCARCQHEWDFEPTNAGPLEAEPAGVEPVGTEPSGTESPIDSPAAEPAVVPAEPIAPEGSSPEVLPPEEKNPGPPPTLVAEPRRARPDTDATEPPRLKRSVLLAWVLSVLVILGVAGAAVQYRAPLMQAWPPSERIFVWLGYAPPTH